MNRMDMTFIFPPSVDCRLNREHLRQSKHIRSRFETADVFVSVVNPRKWNIWPKRPIA